jgi:hypothetical protein
MSPEGCGLLSFGQGIHVVVVIYGRVPGDAREGRNSELPGVSQSLSGARRLDYIPMNDNVTTAHGKRIFFPDRSVGISNHQVPQAMQGPNQKVATV